MRVELFCCKYIFIIKLLTNGAIKLKSYIFDKPSPPSSPPSPFRFRFNRRFLIGIPFGIHLRIFSTSRHRYLRPILILFPRRVSFHLSKYFHGLLDFPFVSRLRQNKHIITLPPPRREKSNDNNNDDFFFSYQFPIFFFVATGFLLNWTTRTPATLSNRRIPSRGFDDDGGGGFIFFFILYRRSFTFFRHRSSSTSFPPSKNKKKSKVLKVLSLYMPDSKTDRKMS